jgi:hypothetical protein
MRSSRGDSGAPSDTSDCLRRGGGPWQDRRTGAVPSEWYSGALQKNQGTNGSAVGGQWCVSDEGCAAWSLWNWFYLSFNGSGCPCPPPPLQHPPKKKNQLGLPRAGQARNITHIAGHCRLIPSPRRASPRFARPLELRLVTRLAPGGAGGNYTRCI